MRGPFQASADICVEHNKFMKYLIDVEEVAEDVIKLFLHCEDSKVRTYKWKYWFFIFLISLVTPINLTILNSLLLSEVNN